MTSPDYGFYASLDADSEGIEGKFYCWSEAEMVEVLGNHAELVNDYFSISRKGNWEKDMNILQIKNSASTLATNHGMTEEAVLQIVEDAKKNLLEARSGRIYPRLDDKILTSWNALMLCGYIDSYQVFDEEHYLNVGLKNAHFILNNLSQPDGGLFRNFKNGQATINGFLDDYAFTINAFIMIYQATFEEKWLDEAYRLCSYSIDHFYDSESGMFFYTSNTDTALIARKMELSDNVIPASNSEMAKNLFLLGHYFQREDFIEMTREMVTHVKETAIQSGAYYANWDIIMAWLAVEPAELSIVGENCEDLRKELQKQYLPNVILSGGTKKAKSALLKGKHIDGKTAIYVCRNKVCQKPVFTVEEAIQLVYSL